MKLAFLSEGVPAEARLLFWGRGCRAFGDGFVSLLLPVYLTALGFGVAEVGLLTAATLLGSAVLTLWVGFYAQRFGRRVLLIAATLLMIATGLGFMLETRFWPLVLIGFAGTLNPSSGDVSLFLPLEHALLAEAVPERRRTAIFAAYSVIGSLVAAAGSLAAGLPDLIHGATSLGRVAAMQAMFGLYAVLGLASYHLYRKLPARLDAGREAKRVPLGPSRRHVLLLAALFSLDSFGGGLVVQSLLALWLFQHFGLTLAATGSIFFWAGLLNAVSYLAAVPLSRRIGLVNTMVFTHLPAQFCMIALAFAPNVPVAVALLLVRALMQQMDVPPRTSYVMAVVTPPERPAASSVTLVPRSLAAAAGPLLAGYLMALSPFGWMLILAGGIKGVYDVLLLLLFRARKPPEETEAQA